MPEHTLPLEPNTKRNGKIAKLPRPLRDQINHALDSGQSATSIAQHLNQIPQVKAMLQAHFEGKPISQQNLSEWKAGGYRDWQLRQELILQHEDFATDVQEIGQTAQDMAQALFGMVMLDYAKLLKSKDKETPEAFEKKRQALSSQIQDIIRLCRCNVQTRNVEVQEGRLERDREKTAEEIQQKFMEWAQHPAIRKAFFLEPEARRATQRRNFGLPPLPTDEAVLRESQADTAPATNPENQANQPNHKPSQTDSCRSGGDDALAKGEDGQKEFDPVGRASSRAASSPPPTSADVTSNSLTKNAGPASGSPAGCGNLAGNNIPGKESPVTPRPERAPENPPTTPLRPLSPIASHAVEREDILDAPRTTQHVSPSSSARDIPSANSKLNPQNSKLKTFRLSLGFLLRTV